MRLPLIYCLYEAAEVLYSIHTHANTHTHFAAFPLKLVSVRIIYLTTKWAKVQWLLEYPKQTHRGFQWPKQMMFMQNKVETQRDLIHQYVHLMFVSFSSAYFRCGMERKLGQCLVKSLFQEIQEVRIANNAINSTSDHNEANWNVFGWIHRFHVLPFTGEYEHHCGCLLTHINDRILLVIMSLFLSLACVYVNVFFLTILL